MKMKMSWWKSALTAFVVLIPAVGCKPGADADKAKTPAATEPAQTAPDQSQTPMNSGDEAKAGDPSASQQAAPANPGAASEEGSKPTQ
jgi:hypothetical protein